MDPDGNRLQNSCSLRLEGHSTMHRVPPVSGTTTTICSLGLYNYYMYTCTLHVQPIHVYLKDKDE